MADTDLPPDPALGGLESFEEPAEPAPGPDHWPTPGSAPEPENAKYEEKVIDSKIEVNDNWTNLHSYTPITHKSNQNREKTRIQINC